jgi:hypothetical protein
MTPPATPTRPNRLHFWIGALALLALPAFCLRLTPNIFTGIGSIDPFLYTGYALHLKSLVARYDITYYMLRMAAILPPFAVYHVFGADFGFLVVRYLKILAGCISIFLIARRYYGAWVAWFCAFALCFSPWYLTSNTWDYVDGFGLNYLLAGIAFILVPRGRHMLWHALAGACFALATNSNLFTFAIWIAFVPSWFFLKRSEPARELARCAAALAGGFFIAYCGLALAVNLARPGAGFFFELYTIRFAASLLGGGSALYFETLGPFFASGHYYVLTPIAIAIGASVLLLRTPASDRHEEKTQMTAALLLYLVLVIVIYLVNHFVFHSPRITLPEYFAYSFVPSILTLMAIVGQLYLVSPQASRPILAAGIAALPLLWWLYGTVRVPNNIPGHYGLLPVYYQIPYAVFISAFGLFIAGAIIANRQAQIALICVLLFALAIPTFFLRTTSQDYQILEDTRMGAAGHDLYLGAVHLIRSVEAVAPPSVGTLGFVYQSDTPSHRFLYTMQSTYLYDYSRLLYPPGDNTTFKKQVAQRSDVVVLGLNTSEVDRILARLRAIGLRTHVLASSTYSGSVLSYVEAIVRIVPPPPMHGPLAETISVASLTAASKLVQAPEISSGSVRFDTDPRQWAYSLRTNLTGRLSRMRGNVSICVDSQVSSGAVGVALTPKGNISAFLTALEIKPAPEIDQYCLKATPASQIGYLIVRNDGADGASTATIQSITVNKP